MTLREALEKVRIAIGVVLTTLALPMSSAFAQTPTFVRSDYPLATNDLIAADLNGDGRPDLAASAITSSPAGINVSVGSSGSASFVTGTSITLSVSNGRDAVWSGACSSGGNKRRTCTFTFNGAASVSANVQ